MKLNIWNEASLDERKYREAWDWAQAKLGLDKFDGTVNLRLTDEHQAFGILQLMKGSDGGTINIEDDNFLMFLVEVPSVISTVQVLFHEMIHVQQDLEGRLKEIKGTDKLLWKDQEWVWNAVKHDDRPWEREAIEGGARLYEEYENERVYERA